MYADELRTLISIIRQYQLLNVFDSSTGSIEPGLISFMNTQFLTNPSDTDTAKQQFTFKANQAGTQDLTFSFVKSWQADDQLPRSQVVVTVWVDDAN